MMGLVSLQGKRPEFTLSTPCEETERGWLSENQKQDPYQEPDHDGTLIWDFRPPEL